MRRIGWVILWIIGAIPYAATGLRFFLDRVVGAPGVVGDVDTWRNEWIPTIQKTLAGIQT